MAKKHIQEGTPMPPAADMWFRLKQNKAAMFGLVVVIFLIVAAIVAQFAIDYSDVVEPNADECLQAPSREHIFGTDDKGRDLFIRVMYGAKYSLTFGIVCTLFSLLAGAALGAAAAFFGGKVDSAITFVVDAAMCIPGTLLSLSLVAVLGKGFINLIIAITISSIPSFARIVRSILLTVVEQDYIEAAHALGVSNLRIIFVHALPNAIGLIVVNAAMNVSGLIMSAAGLSFIGMGIQPPNPEWGAMLSDALEYMRICPHIVIFPAIAIVLTALSFNLLGDGLSEALDPRMKE